MGKADKREAKDGIDAGQKVADTNYGFGIGGAQNRLYGEADPITGQRAGGRVESGQKERSNILGGYGSLAETGGLQPGEYSNLMQGDYGRGYNRSYLDTYNDLSGRSGGFDTRRLGNVNHSSSYLRGLPGSDAYSDVNQGISGLLKGGNWGDVNTSIGGLQDI